MWFVLALIALLCWSGSDLFSKIGCREPDDKLAHLKMVMAVGLVMGLHAAYEIFIGGTEISWHVIWTYLPVSLLYIGSMTLGEIKDILCRRFESIDYDQARQDVLPFIKNPAAVEIWSKDFFIAITDSLSAGG